MPDSQCEEPITDFFNQWTEKISRSTRPTNNDLVQDISGNLKEIEKSIASVTQWKKEVTEVFRKLRQDLEPKVPGNLRYIAKNVNKIKRGTTNIVKLPSVELIKSEPNNHRQSTTWKKLKSEETIMASPGMAMVKSTYDGLEPRVKLCFLCLSIFPENLAIRKRSLIYWWIGEGFVDGKNAEQEAEECFKKLCDSGLVEGIYRQYSRSPHSCRLHPWIRWMAIEIAKETMFFDFDLNGKPNPYPSNCTRRACVATSRGEKEEEEEEEEEAELRAEKVNLEPNASKLRSLFNVDVNCIECDEDEFKKLKELVTLQLGRWSTAPEHHIELLNPTFLDHLKLLKKLRYLGLQGISRITELSGIQRLSELRVLDLRACHNLEKLPAEIASLKKLTHLDVSECYLLEYMPKGLGELPELQLLNGFVVNIWRKEACDLRELTNLNNLQKLSITVGKDAMQVLDPNEEVKDGVLEPIGDITGLQSLRITWGSTIENKKYRTRKMIARLSVVTKAVMRFKRVLSRVRQPVPVPAPDHDGDGAGAGAGAGARLSIITKAIMKFRKVPRRVRLALRTPPEQAPLSKITLFLPPSLTKLDLQCYPEEEPPRFIRKEQHEKKKSLEKLYFRGGWLKSLSGIKKEEVSEVKFIRLGFLRKDFDMKKDDFKTKFPSLKKLQVVPRKDEAGTSSNFSI